MLLALPIVAFLGVARAADAGVPAPCLAPPGEAEGAAVEVPVQRVDSLRLQREEAAARTQLLTYSAQAARVLVGRILTSHPDGDGGRVVALEVEQALRGRAGEVVEFHMPAVPDDDVVVPPVVHGYRVLVYLDRNDELLGGNALFFVEGGFAWRNKRDGVFLRPSADRVWIEAIDPRPDYVVFSLDEIRSTLDVRAARRALRRRRRSR